jgi:LysM repeat protein
LVVILLLLAVGMFAYAPQARLDSIATHRVRVESGDSLWTIARAHPIDGLKTDQVVELIRNANELGDSVVYAGQVLEVPTSELRQGDVAQR